MDLQRGQDEDADEKGTAKSFSDLITSASRVHTQEYLASTTKTVPSTEKSIEGSARMPKESTVIPAGVQESNYGKDLHKIDGILNLSRDEADSFVDDISDYDYEDEDEDEKETTLRPTPKTRQQFGKSLNGNSRKAGKMLAKPNRKHELEFELKETSDNMEDESDTEASSVTPVIDGYNQSDSFTTRRELSALATTTTTTTMSASDNDDIVEINTSSTTSEQDEATSSAIYVIENDFQIKQKPQLELELEKKKEEGKPVADDNNNERDLADNYEEHKDTEKGQTEILPQSINHPVSDVMLNDAAHFDNDDIDIVKLDEPPNSNEVDIYKMAVEQPKMPQPQQTPPAPPAAPPSSENEVLKEQEIDIGKAAHLIPLKPYVSERFDRPSKRILVNLTIATDDGSDSVYTLHVAVPTGGGSHNVEQVLTHESKAPDEDNSIEPLGLGACSSEPPPRMPDCPCSCLPPPSPTFLTSDDHNEHDTDSATLMRIVKDDDDHSDDIRKSQLASITASPPTVATSTATNDFSTEFDNSISVTDNISDNDTDTDTDTDARANEQFACPDVMPILILEGDCTVCSHS